MSPSPIGGQRPPLQRTINLLPYQCRWVEDDSKLKIAVKARQIGYSFAATLRAVLKCLERKTTWIFLSKGERQSRLLMEKVHDHIRSCGIVARSSESTFFEGTSLKQLEVRFPNGSVIYGLPANPDTARGYSGHVTLDEFAFHADAGKIYAALFPTITRGYGLEVISTPNGTQGKFYELAKAADLVERKWEAGNRKSAEPYSLLPTSYSRPSLVWSSHCCDIYDAVRQGLKVDINLLRNGCEEATAWQQEFCCQFVSTAENFFSPELIDSCMSGEAGLGIRDSQLATRGSVRHPRESGDPDVIPPAPSGTGMTAQVPTADSRLATPEFFLGIDIGRRHDRTVFWVDELQVLGSGDWGLGPSPAPDELHRGHPLPQGEGWKGVSPSPRPQGKGERSLVIIPLPQGEGIPMESGRVRVAVARLIRTMDNAPFAEQLAYARELLSLTVAAMSSSPLEAAGGDTGATASGSPFLIRRCCIDATGIGAHMAETLAREFGPRVEPVVFTAAVKEDLAFRTKRRMEARLSVLPDTREIRRAFSAVKKFITPSGNLRFDAVRTEAGHADEFWAKALADLAADPDAHRAAARAEDAFLADSLPIVSLAAFRELEANWSELM